MNHSINFILEGVILSVPEGSTLLEAQIAAGLPTDAPCGGKAPAASAKSPGGGRARWNGVARWPAR